MSTIWIVDGVCFDRKSVCDRDGPWSYHKTQAGAETKKKALEANPSNDRFSFEVREVNLED